MDFKAHQLDKHANQLSTRQRRQAERVETNFGYDRTQSCRGTTAGGNNINRRAGSGGNKAKSGVNASMGDDAAPCENRDVLGVSQLASRAHVPGAGPANHVSRRAMFGANLTTTTTPSPQGVSADRPRTVTDSRSVEQRHQSYMDKVSSTLNGSEQRITSFRHSVRIFKNGESSARDLISTIHSLVGEMDDCAPLVNGLVDLVEDQDKVGFDSGFFGSCCCAWF
uniref:Cytoplasmic protein n=1 Tax=Melanopsichium pennsylvanicum 4 TaxID=1398559 RepID=A0A077R9M6_9BASI|nr:cytoplasmic protein [Melanopsichium pennsylvanicum 4]